jgi:hypothetical protein
MVYEQKRTESSGSNPEHVELQVFRIKQGNYDNGAGCLAGNKPIERFRQLFKPVFQWSR